MKVSVSKENLAVLVRRVLNAVNTKTTIPVLNNVLIEAEADGTLTLAATDLEVYVRSSAQAVVEEAGRTTLPARKFAQIVTALPNGNITLVADENQQTTVSCEKSFFRIVGLDAAEFPSEEEPDGEWIFNLAAVDFRKALSKVCYATSTDETRHVLNGILMSIRSGILTTVATDGRRLALMERQLDGEMGSDCDAILPQKVVGELMKVLDSDEELVIQLSESSAAFTFGSTLITSKLVQGSYPNYRQVIPGSFSQSAVVPRDMFSTVLNRVALVVSETSSAVLVKLESAQMTISAASAEVGEGNEPFEVSYEGEPVTISFNPQFLLDPLKALEADQVVLDFNDEYSPISISGDEGFLYVIMPMRN